MPGGCVWRIREIGTDPAPCLWLLRAGERPARIEPIRVLSPRKAGARSNTPSAPGACRPPRGMSGGTGEEGEGCVLIYCGGRVLGELYFGLSLGLFLCVCVFWFCLGFGVFFCCWFRGFVGVFWLLGFFFTRSSSRKELFFSPPKAPLAPIRAHPQKSSLKHPGWGTSLRTGPPRWFISLFASAAG